MIAGGGPSNVCVDIVIHKAFCLIGGGVTTLKDGDIQNSRGDRVEIHIVCRIGGIIPCVRGEYTLIEPGRECVRRWRIIPIDSTSTKTR